MLFFLHTAAMNEDQCFFTHFTHVLIDKVWVQINPAPETDFC